MNRLFKGFAPPDEVRGDYICFSQGKSVNVSVASGSTSFYAFVMGLILSLSTLGPQDQLGVSGTLFDLSSPQDTPIFMDHNVYGVVRCISVTNILREIFFKIVITLGEQLASLRCLST